MLKPLELTAADETRQETLPEFWPQDPLPTPVRPVWIPWPIAVLLAPLFWLTPKRMGPHFAAVRWPGVIIAHVLWGLYGVGLILTASWIPQLGWVPCLLGRTPRYGIAAFSANPTVGEFLRQPLALTAALLTGHPVADFPRLARDSQHLLLILGAVIAVEAGLVALAWALRPYLAAGERGRDLFSRCMKLTFWTTTTLPVLGLAFQAIEVTEAHWAISDPLWMLAMAAYAAWFMWICFRGGQRYGGEAEGPGWEPRRPLCESCGYVLTGLNPAGHCPECGEAITASLPANRRPLPFGTRGGVLWTSWHVLRDRQFFKHLAVAGQHASARRFAIAVCVLTPLATLPGLVLHALLDPDIAKFAGSGRYPDLRLAASGILGWVGGSFLTTIAVGLLCPGARLSPRGSLRDAASITFCLSPWLALIMAATSVAAACNYWILNNARILVLPLPITQNWTVGTDVLLAAVPWLLPFLVFYASVRPWVRAIRQVRYANG